MIGRKKEALIPSTRGPLYTLLLGPLIYYRRGRDIFDVSVGKIKAILLLVPLVVRDRGPKAGLAHGNRRCLDTNMRALIESGFTNGAPQGARLRSVEEKKKSIDSHRRNLSRGVRLTEQLRDGKIKM